MSQADSQTSRTLFPTVDWQRIIPMILWPISLMMVFQRSVILGVNGDRTNDFAPVWDAASKFLRSMPVYDANYDTVDPHYLYAPSGTLLMSPLALMDYEDARWVFIGVSVAALLAAAYLITRMFGFGLTSWVMPVVLFFFFSTETVAHTLIFTNFNAFVLLGQVLFMMLLLQRRDLWAGVPIGLTLAVKPVLAVLLLIPLLNRQWKAFIGAIALPVLFTALAWPKAVDPGDYIKRTLPYLSETRDYYNSSIGGNGAYFGVDTWLLTLLKIAFVVMAIAGIAICYRLYRSSDELLWMATTSGILLGTSFLISSLGQGYYSMLLFPLLMTVLRPGSVMRNWPAWLAVYGCMTFDMFYSFRWAAFGRALEYNKVTWGWSLLMIVVFCVLLFRYLDLRKQQNSWWPSPDAATAVPATTKAA